MKVIVCGAGQVGFSIAKQLAAENNDVTVVDLSSELIQRISDQLEVQAMVGHASHPDVLEEAGANDSDMIVAVTYSDEVNMVACQVAHSLFEVPTKIARVRAQSYLNPLWGDLFSRDNMPIDVIISPEVEVARAVRRRLEVPGAFDVVPFAGGRLRAVGVLLTGECPVLRTPIGELSELFPGLASRIVGIVRDGRAMVPSDADELEAGDEVYFIADRNHVQRTLAMFGHEETEARRIIVVGGGNIGLFLARELEQSHPNLRIKIIELDKERAEFVADNLNRTVVLNGDALDVEILREANVGETETLVAVANDDEVNILSSLLAKREGCQRVMTLINNPSYGSLVTALGVDVYIAPRETTVSTILQQIRRGRILGLHSLRDGLAEIIEAQALTTSSLVGRPLGEIELPRGIMLGAIARGEDEVIIPRADTVIQAQDRVVLFALARMVPDVERLFSVRLEFF